MTSIAIATCAELATLFPDEQPLVDFLESNGIRVYPVVWNSPEINWDSYDLVLLRNTWDYHQQIDVFRDWLLYLENADITVLNPLPLVRWNIDKSYLQQLDKQGITTHETIFATGKTLKLADVLQDQQWQQAVVKPVISASGDHTWVITPENAQTSQQAFDWLNERLGMMIQPMATQIQTDGEYSLVFFNGEFHHAVKKRPADGHLLVHEERGGTIDNVSLEDDIIAQAQRTIDASSEIINIVPTYARVDGFLDQGRYVLMELECIEPELYLTRYESAAERFGNLVLEAIG